MSHTQKFKRAAVGQLGAHVDRLRDEDHEYGNERIDTARSHLNQELSGCNTPLSQMVAEAIRDAPGTTRKDAVVMISTVTTLPTNWPEGRDPMEFFRAVREYDLQFWPPSFREARCTVHLDETTPHAHHIALPLDDQGRFAFSRLYTRAMYKRYHQGLQEFVRGATHLEDLRILIPEEEQGEQALSKLSQPEYIAAKREEERLEAAKAQLEADVRGLEGVRAALEPVAETVGASARYLAEHRGDGARAREGATHLREARDRMRDLEAEKGRLEDEVRRLERHAELLDQDVRRARGRRADLRERLDVVGERVRAVVTAVVTSARERYYRVPQAVAEALRSLGVPWDKVTEMGRATWDAQERKLTGLPTVQHTLGIER